MAVEAHTFSGISFPGRKAVGEIVQELDRQAKARKDYVLRSDKLKFVIRDNQFLLQTPTSDGNMLAPLSRRVHVQLANWMGMRMTDRLYKWLAYGEQSPEVEKALTKTGAPDTRRNWDVWANLCNDFLQREKAYRLVRFMADTHGTVYCRALLSDKYKIIGNGDFFFAIVEQLKSVGAEIWHARLSEDKFYGYAVAKGLTGQVNTDRAFDPGDGWSSRWYGKKDDVVNAAMAFGNSETGEGGCFLSNAILRRVCENYCVWHDLVSVTHIGKRTGIDTMLSQETIAAQNATFFLKIRDLVKATFDPVRFQEILDALNGATRDIIEDPEKAANALQVVFDISDERKTQLCHTFIRNSDMSRYGLLNAVTEYAHNDRLDPDTGFSMERLGCDLAGTTMESLYTRAEKLLAAKDKARPLAAVRSGADADFGL